MELRPGLPAWIASYTLVGVIFCIDVAPICLYGESECHVPTVADLFDRIIQQSSRMFSISTDLHSEIEDFPRRNTIGRQKCHTHWIVTPGDKEKAQRLGHEALTEAILRLLCIGDMVRELREGVLKVTIMTDHDYYCMRSGRGLCLTQCCIKQNRPKLKT
uniref:Uncharacterized protein n=1 Tax=Neogobius melanostomus TaxID=47308 RepID=A0A8C6U1H6_9GOBI